MSLSVYSVPAESCHCLISALIQIYIKANPNYTFFFLVHVTVFMPIK